MFLLIFEVVHLEFAKFILTLFDILLLRSIHELVGVIDSAFIRWPLSIDPLKHLLSSQIWSTERLLAFFVDTLNTGDFLLLSLSLGLLLLFLLNRLLALLLI